MKTQINSLVASPRGDICISGKKDGYTIVEVMIFMAVTSALFVAIIATFSGRQARAEFSIATREIESRLQDIANDVSTGYYNNPGTFTCTAPAGTPILTVGASPQGTNEDCTYIGRVAQFAVDGNNKQYNLFTVVGSRLGSDGNDSDDLDDANPTPLVLPGLIENNQFPVGLVIDGMWRVDGGARTPLSAVGFFTTFGGGSGNESSLSIDILPLGDGTDNAIDVASAINAITSTSPPANPNG